MPTQFSAASHLRDTSPEALYDYIRILESRVIATEAVMATILADYLARSEDNPKEHLSKLAKLAFHHTQWMRMEGMGQTVKNDTDELIDLVNRKIDAIQEV